MAIFKKKLIDEAAKLQSKVRKFYNKHRYIVYGCDENKVHLCLNDFVKFFGYIRPRINESTGNYHVTTEYRKTKFVSCGTSDQMRESGYTDLMLENARKE